VNGSSAYGLVEDFVGQLGATPEVADHVSEALGGILLAEAYGDIDAARAWKRIEREIQSPLRAREPGDEHPYQPFIDRVVIVVALAGHYETMKQRNRALH
jgi:hypothetical protein